MPTDHEEADSDHTVSAAAQCGARLILTHHLMEGWMMDRRMDVPPQQRQLYYFRRLSHLPQEWNQVFGPGGAVLDTDGTEELDQRLHRVAGVDIIGPLRGEERRRSGAWGWMNGSASFSSHQDSPIHGGPQRRSPPATTSRLQTHNQCHHLQKTGRSLGLKAEQRKHTRTHNNLLMHFLLLQGDKYKVASITKWYKKTGKVYTHVGLGSC